MISFDDVYARLGLRPTRTDLNGVRFDPAARRGHVESYFLKANDPAGERAIWLKATIFVASTEPDRPLAEGWAIAFDRRGGEARNVAVKHVLPYADASFERSGLGVGWRVDAADHLSIREGATEGSIGMRDHRIGWKLRFDGPAEPILPFFSEAMYQAPIPKSKLVSPLPDARFSGEVVIDGVAWNLDGWRGMQGHNWGRGHADLYAWCHVNQWEEDPSFVLEGFSAQVRIGPVLTPLTTIVCVRSGGVAYDFNRPLELFRSTGDVALRRWEFSASSRRAHVEGSVEARTEDMVGLYYPNPDGPMTYCLNSKLARARVRFEAAGQPPVTLTSRAAALEIGTKQDDHGVRMYA
jgi:hypothetical protein